MNQQEASDTGGANASEEAASPDEPLAEAQEPPAGAFPEAGPTPAGDTSGVVDHRRRRTVTRFLLAFAFGLLGVLAVSAGALAAYESSNAGRILPGVRVGSVDLSGLAPAEAAARLHDGFASLGDGELILSASGFERTVTYADLGRRVDVDEIVARAMDVGRGGPAIERIASNVRILVRRVDITPLATLERAALRYEIAALAAAVDRVPANASASLGDIGFLLDPGADGRSVDIDAALRAAATLLADPTASSSVRIDVPIRTVAPTVTTQAASAARAAAERIAKDIALVNGSESWTIPAATVRSWISFASSADGGYGPVVAREGLEAALTATARDVALMPISATFLFADDESVVGVTDARDGRELDVPGTITTLVDLVEQRVAGMAVPRVPISITTVEPDLTTAEAAQTAPLMKPISQWTTYFPIGIKNGQGANIWIPARDIDGQVVLPGEWFDFWKAIGPVTRERGYRDGGAIINGHTEPQGALAGGICSCSTTLFNAALRAGLEMGARRNHYYYIDRYPLGLDATVFQSSSGSVQTMSFRNDTDAPILIRGTGWAVGGKGYVRFVLWSVPNGRTVEFSVPIVKNIKPPSDTTVYTTELAPGVKERTEFPVEGKDVWVTRTVRDALGALVHEETYYSHYARITGILRIGIAPDATPPPVPTPSPSPAPSPSPTT